MMKIVQIDEQNIEIIESFISNKLPENFRYFNNRCYKKALNNHIYTVIGCVDNEYVSYGHIDYDLKKNKYWLGICVLKNYQNKGYGKFTLQNIMNYINDSKIHKINLTVDLDNIIAIKLYEKFGFKIVEKKEKYYEMIYYNNLFINLPVSFGEAFDKLTILDIKLKYIKDNRVIDVQKEYDMIYNEIKPYFNTNTEFYYNILKIINENIWVLQDITRDPKNNNPDFDMFKMCLEILDENDRRFRVKAKINNLLSSSIKEQKGYKKKKIFVLNHLGLGDNITSIGMIRYLSTIYDEVVTVCKKRNEKNMLEIYKDDNSIKLYIVNEDHEISEAYGYRNFRDITKGFDVILTGLHKYRNNFDNIPFCFYEDANIPKNIFWDYFHIPDTLESYNLFKLVEKIPYIIIHSSSSTRTEFSYKDIEKHSKYSINDILYIDLNKNIYQEGDKFYDLANNFVNKLLIEYKDLIINSKKIYVCNSSVFCLCLNLNIKTDDCFVVSNQDFSYLYDNSGFDPNNRKKFKNIKF